MRTTLLDVASRSLLALICTACCESLAAGGTLTLDDIDRQWFQERGGDWQFDEGAGARPTYALAVFADPSSGPSDLPWAGRGAVEFDTSGAPPSSRWERVTLVFQTASHFFDPVLQVHGFIGDGSVQRLDVLQNLLLTEIAIAGGPREVKAWEVDVTQWTRDARSRYLGFSFRIKDDTTDAVDQDAYVIAPTPGYDPDGLGFTGPQLRIADVPEPSLLTLLAAGLCVLPWRRRKVHLRRQ
jgi:hypothetical protein